MSIFERVVRLFRGGFVDLINILDDWKKDFFSVLERWKNVFVVLLDPWIVIFIGVSFYLGVQVQGQNEQAYGNLLTILLALSTGILGGLVGKKWDSYVEENVQTARGILSVRSLKLIFTNIESLENRVAEYLMKYSKEKRQNKEVVITYMEEIIQRCGLLEDEILSSIENWSDLIPEEANARLKVEAISKLKHEVAKLENRLAGIQTIRTEDAERTEEQIQELENEKRNLEAELAKAKGELSVNQLNFESTGNAVNFNQLFTLPSIDWGGLIVENNKEIFRPVIEALGAMTHEPTRDKQKDE